MYEILTSHRPRALRIDACAGLVNPMSSKPSSAEPDSAVMLALQTATERLVVDRMAEYPGVVEVVESAEGIQRRMSERAPPVERFRAARGVLERGGM